MNWDDLRIIAAVAEQGTYARASARLQLDETTVGRRISRIQAILGITLFEATNGVRKPTAHCEAVLAHIREMGLRAAQISNIGLAVPGVTGTFRIASTPSVLEEILAPMAAEFLIDNPGLTLQFMGSDDNVNFSRWETDLAVRLRKPARGDFTISRLGESRLYLFEPASPGPPDKAPVVCRYPKEIDFSPESRFMMERGLHGGARCITESLPAMRSLIATHSAIGVLPKHVCGDLLGDPLLRATPLEERQEFWLLVQNHLKRDHAARVVIDWVRRTFSTLI